MTLLVLSCGGRNPVSPAKRVEIDQKAIAQLAAALIQIPQAEGTPPYPTQRVSEEAHRVAKALVDQTRETNKEFKMSGGPKWHNAMISLGFKKKGRCYDWVPELLKALPPQPMLYFERHWGGSFESMGRENNGVIITKRGAPLKTGIVYDAWRGVGFPYWRLVSKDVYPWKQRFSEMEILMGEAKVEPKR